MYYLEGLNMVLSPTLSRATGENLVSQRRQMPGCWGPPRPPASLCCHGLLDAGPSGCPSPLPHLPILAVRFFLLFKVHPSAIHPLSVRCSGHEKAYRVSSGESSPVLGRAAHTLGSRRLLPQMAATSQEGAFGHAE